LSGQLFRELHEFCGTDFKALFFKSPDYLTGKMSLYTIRLDDY